MSEQFNAELDHEIDQLGLGSADIDGLFLASDALAKQFRLRATLADPATEVKARAQITQALFAERIGKLATQALVLVVEQVESTRQLEDEVERQGVRLLLATCPELDQIQEELFKFARMVAANHDLQAKLRDPMIEIPARQELVASILTGMAHPLTVRLARRAVLARAKTVLKTLDYYVAIAGQIKSHRIAVVTLASKPSQAQLEKLHAELSRIYGVGIDIQIKLDPSVLGGGKVQVADDQIDGTIRRKLDEAKQRISE